MNKKTAAIIGSTGLIGHLCLELLLKNDAYEKVISYSRRKIEIQHPKLVQIIDSLDALSKHQDELKADDFFCCLGTTIKVAGSQREFQKVDLDAPIAFAQIAKNNHAKVFSVISAMGANAGSKIFYNRTKGEMENELKKLDLECVMILRPSLLLGERKESRLGEKIAGSIFSFLPDHWGPLNSLKPIEGIKVAEKMVSLAQSPKKGVNIYSSDQLQ